ncbi:MAG: radical SAM protein [Candidatus Omnitrophica bacterium]|nr:radical SAM protein [Candidatus Omnitrophota bacterium]
MKSVFKYIYGPVPSWRLGSSLGIDPISKGRKVCSFDCVYCQIGKTGLFTNERKKFIEAKEIIEELARLPALKIDYITFSGAGEPTLAENLGEMIKAVKLICKEPIAVITNSSLMELDEVRKELALADFVVVKLDACSQESLQEINRPVKGLRFDDILEGIKEFRNEYKGKLALQIMFIENNKQDINKYIYLANYIKPDEVQVNTPLRPCNVRPLSRGDILKIKDYFISTCKGINVVSAYDERTLKGITSVSDEATLKRRGKVK